MYIFAVKRLLNGTISFQSGNDKKATRIYATTFLHRLMRFSIQFVNTEYTHTNTFIHNYRSKGRSFDRDRWISETSTAYMHQQVHSSPMHRLQYTEISIFAIFSF